MRKLDLASGLIVILSLLGVAIFWGPYLADRWSISAWGDTIHLTGPLFCEISRSVKAGAQPWMNWSTFEAIDYNPHVAVYYPLYFFGWLQFCSAVDAAKAVDVIAIVHIGIFFLTTASLVRATGLPIPASIVGASLATTLPNIYFVAVFPTFIAPLAWLPLATEGLVRLYYRRQYVLGGLLLAAGTGAMLTAGPGSNLLSALVLIGSVLTVDAAIGLAKARDAGVGWRLLGALCLVAALTAMLCLGSTINLYSHIGEFIRSTRTGAVIGSANTGNLTEILAEKLSWSDLAQLLYPSATIHVVGNYLLGPVLLTLAILGAASGRRNRRVRAFGFVACLSIALVFLLPRQIVMLWSVVPGLSHTRHLSIVATPLTLAAAVLAAHGFRALIEKPFSIDRPTLLILRVASSLLALFTVSLISTMPLGSFAPAWFLAALALAGGFAVIVLPNLLGQTARRVGGAALLAIQFAFVFGSVLKPAGVPAVANSPAWRSIEAALDYVRATDPQPGRIVVHTSISADKIYGDNISYLTAGTIATYKDLATFTHLTTPRIYWKIVREYARQGENDLGFLGGKYLLAAVPLDASVGPLVFENGGIQVYRLKDSRPVVLTYCFWNSATSPSVVPTGASFGRLPRLDGESAQAAIKAQTPNNICEAGGAPLAPRLARADNAIEFSLNEAAGRLLVLNYPPYASWRLQIANHDVPIYNLRDEQIVAFLPDGVSGHAVLSYLPRSSEMRIFISKLAWLVLFAVSGIFVGMKRHRWCNVGPGRGRNVRSL